MKKFRQKFEWMQESRPSILRNGILVFIYRSLFGLIGLVTIGLGLAMIINAAFGQHIISRIIGENEESETVLIYKALGWFIGILLIITGVVAFFIYTLAGKLQRRNTYIRGLEMLTEEVISHFEEQDDEADTDTGKEDDDYIETD